MPKHHGGNDLDKVAGESSSHVPFAIAGAAILRHQYEEMRANEDGTRLGEDSEALHQMRVATRRLRAALRTFVPDDLRDTFSPIATGARDMAHALGAVRDLDVLGDDLRARKEATPSDALAYQVLLGALQSVRNKRRQELLAVLDGPVARHFWVAFPEAVRTLEATADPHLTVRKAAPPLLRRRLRRVIKSGQRLQAPTSLELHRVRIRCKHLRDACDFFKPWFKKAVDPIIEITGSLQDTLGALHDADVAPESLQALVDAARDGGMPEPAGGYDLATTVLAVVQDRRQHREDLLVHFREQWADLYALRHATKFKSQ